MGPSSNARRKYENTIPAPDEGWWESVLAEESRYSAPSSHTKHASQKAQPAAAEKRETAPPAVPVKADWERVKDLFQADRIITVKVVGHNRGGLLVQGDGLSGFVPFSHLVELAGRGDVSDRDVSLENYEGKTLNVKVIECAPEEGRVVFSERAALAGSGRRSELFQSLQTGARVKGTVTNITDFGVFVDLGGVEGLIHISELSWGRVSHPEQVVGLGSEIDVQVLDLSPERCRVALSLKRLLPNPWERALTDFAEGQVLPAEITSVLSYGAFARLDAGVEGLIHATEMSLEPGQAPRDLLAEGQRVQVRVLHVDPAHQRMGLSLHLNQ